MKPQAFSTKYVLNVNFVLVRKKIEKARFPLQRIVNSKLILKTILPKEYAYIFKKTNIALKIDVLI